MSFEDLGLSSGIVDALEAKGIEEPAPFQEEAIPVVRRGNNLVGRAGPGAGTLVAYGAPLLDRLDREEGNGSPRGVCLAPTRDRAVGLARSLARIGRGTDQEVAALDDAWVDPEGADVLFGTPADVLAAIRDSRLKLEAIVALVVDGAGTIHDLDGFDALETVAEFVPSGAQRVVLSLPLPPALEPFLEGHVKRAVHVPPRRATDGGEDDDEIPRRGTLYYRVVEGERREAAARAVAALRTEGAQHVLLHLHGVDEPGTVGSDLVDHGHEVGEPGDADRPVWIGTDPRSTRTLLSEHPEPGSVATLGLRVPMDPDMLDQRHAEGGRAVTLLRGREFAHLRETARIAGYALEPSPDGAPSAIGEEVARFRERLRRALEAEDLAPHFLLLEPLIERSGAGRVAAAAAALLRRSQRPATDDVRAEPTPGRPPPAPDERPAWVRLFISLGHRDDAGPGDILGAITGEVGIDGSSVGRIDIRDTFSLVEVDPSVAENVIRTMNGITVRGRSIRVDFDRSGSRRRGAARRRGERST